MPNTTREDYLKVLKPNQKFSVIIWNIFAKKRFYIFEHYWNIGKSCRASYRDAKKMSSREVKYEYMSLRNKEINQK